MEIVLQSEIRLNPMEVLHAYISTKLDRNNTQIFQINKQH